MLLDALRLALQVMVPVDSVRDVYRDRLLQGRFIPSETTIYRHRLTICMGYAALQQRKLAEVLAGGNELLRWAMVGASPIGGHDWLCTATGSCE